MFAKLKELIFPCDKVIKELMAEHSQSVANNQDAHDRFMKACKGQQCPLPKPKHDFERLGLRIY